MRARGRYCQQETFPFIGPKGQAKLGRSRVLVVGCGALGGTLATLLARAGVGFIRLVDRDVLELHNLQRQVLYNEDDVLSGFPKAILAKNHLTEINSSVRVEAVVAHVDRGNILRLMEDMDLILDGSDNLATRHLINEASVKTGKPWIHGGAVGSTGNVMPFIPGRNACFACVFPDSLVSTQFPTCETAGILGPAATVVASVEVMEAIKFLVGDLRSLLPGMLTVDVWDGNYRVVDMGMAVRRDCSCCGQRDFKYLDGRAGAESVVLCGRDAYQIAPAIPLKLDLKQISKKVQAAEILTENDYLIRFQAQECGFILFHDGRAIVEGTPDGEQALQLYARMLSAVSA